MIGASVNFDALYDSIRVGAHGLSIKADGESGSFSANLEVNFDSVTLGMNSTEMSLYDLSLMTRIREKNIDTVIVSVRTAKSALSIASAIHFLQGRLLLMQSSALYCTSDIAVLPKGHAMDGAVAIEIAVPEKLITPINLYNCIHGCADVMGYHIDTLHVNLDVADRVLQIKPLMVKSGPGSISVNGSVDARTFFTNGYLSRSGSMQELAYQLDVNADRVMLDTLVSGMSGIADVTVRLDGKGADPDSLIANVVLSAGVDSFCRDSRRTPRNVPLQVLQRCVQEKLRCTSLTQNLARQSYT